MKLAMICAMAQNGVIGRDNGLPWHLPEDLRHFKRTTMGSPIIMGRKTWESIGRALPGRTSIVVSANPAYRAEGATVAGSLEAAIKQARNIAAHGGSKQAFVIGGAGLYRAALPLARRFYLTRVHGRVAGDTFLTGFNEDEWEEVSRQDFPTGETSPYAFSICELKRLGWLSRLVRLKRPMQLGQKDRLSPAA